VTRETINRTRFVASHRHAIKKSLEPTVKMTRLRSRDEGYDDDEGGVLPFSAKVKIHRMYTKCCN
jgi:hypothetical protein